MAGLTTVDAYGSMFINERATFITVALEARLFV
jgi:hypothetical protein